MPIAKGLLHAFKKWGPALGKGFVQKGRVAKETGAAALRSIKEFGKHPVRGTLKSLAPTKMLAIGKRAIQHPVRTAAKEWKRTSFGGKALFGGLVVAPQALDIAAEREPGGEGRAQQAGRLLGSMAGGLYFSRAPLLGSMLGWSGAEAIGSTAGKLLGKKTGLGKARPITEMSLTEKLHKTAEKKKIRRFARERIREVVDKPSQLGDIATATWRDPTGTFERQA